MTTAEAVILAVIEGLTEFLPVSSTGHMILTEGLLKIGGLAFDKVYIINIQFGAIVAVLVLYWRRFFQSLDFYLKLFVAFLPAAVIGLVLIKYIEALLSSVMTVAISLIVGGVVLILTDRLFRDRIGEQVNQEEAATETKVNEFGMHIERDVLPEFKITWLQAFIIGCFQTLGMIPGVSRSAVTILGGLTQKFNMRKAAEFSFFLAVPTIFAAAGYKLYKAFDAINSDQLMTLLLGNVISFVVGMLAIKFFIGLITRYGLKFFGYYRIILGLTILLLIAMGYKLEINH
jgi:undecaprenyl-diphosphatase